MLDNGIDIRYLPVTKNILVTLLNAIFVFQSFLMPSLLEMVADK
jgi:hypothetical protein